MIRIKKSTRTPDVGVYSNKKFDVDGQKMTAAERENLAAIDFYENEIGDKVNFSVYRNEEVKDLLIEIFKGKCAYCETQVRRAAKGDIEHYRPKGRIETSEGEKLKPGYYWLAADWNNLLLSCGNCNQKGRFRLNTEGEKVPMGKGDLFPLSNESKRIRSRGTKISGENRYTLLLNPCTTDPIKHLVFNDEGEVEPAKSKSGRVSKRGLHSIEVYGLHRVELVKGRKQFTIEINILVMKIYEKLKFIEERTDLPEDVKDFLITDVENEVMQLNTKFQEDAEFLGAKRQKLQRIIDEFPGIPAKLLDYGLNLEDLL